MVMNKYLRRRLLPTVALAAASIVGGVGAIGWTSTTSSSSDYVSTAVVGEITTIVIGAGERASIDFVGDPSNHFAVSFRQCSLEEPQPLQIQYSEKLHTTPLPGGCIYAENEAANIGESGCTFWQYDPEETYHMSGIIYEDLVPLEAGRVRFENRGSGNATVDVAMFSEEIAVPTGLADNRIWVEDDFTKLGRAINTSVSVFFNNENNYCDVYDCTVSAYLNDLEEGQEALSLCQVEAEGEAVYTDERFKNPIELIFDLPEGDEYFLTLILSAKNTTQGADIFTTMTEFGLDRIVILQTDSAQPDSSARVLAGLSLMTLTWLMLFNVLLSSVASTTGWQTETAVPSLGW
ncbi:unnamed protein product [Pylaiella littoralis]